MVNENTLEMVECERLWGYNGHIRIMKDPESVSVTSGEINEYRENSPKCSLDTCGGQCLEKCSENPVVLPHFSKVEIDSLSIQGFVSICELFTVD
jgi:hypothetical protein